MHIIHNISEKNLMDIDEDVNFKIIMDNNEDALSEDDGYNSDQSEDTKNKSIKNKCILKK